MEDEDGSKDITLSLMHRDWRRLAQITLLRKKASRKSIVAPRDSGKTTWWFLIIPMWAAAHGHTKFIAAFADSGPQATNHLSTFKNELDNNDLLRMDYPELVTPAKRASTGGNVADNQGLYVSTNGFAFKAAGIDASNLGLKVNEARPDFIIFDDIEPDEASYSAYQAKKRLGTVLDAVLPMNIRARVVFTGTVTMSGGITHQLVQSVNGQSEPEKWIEDEHIEVFHYQPILNDRHGREHSIWPAKWPLEYLLSIQHTRSYAKNFKNQPVQVDGDYWTQEDFTYGVPGPVTHTLLSVDGAVTTKQKSDYTGLSIVSYKPVQRPRNGEKITDIAFPHAACVVWNAIQVKLAGEFLRQRVLDMIAECEETDHPVRIIYIEANQGHNLWLSVFHDMPVPVVIESVSGAKEVRAAQLLNHYQRKRVFHAKELPALETQMCDYPDVLHDDMIDSVGQGVTFYAKKRKKTNKQSRSVSYISRSQRAVQEAF